LTTLGSRLTGQRVLVVGASSGIGRATATGAAAEGAVVVAAARRIDRLKELEDIIPLQCDVTNADDIDALVAGAVEEMGGLDAVVYSAGKTKLQALENGRYEDWIEIFSTNVFGATQVTRAALPHLLAKGSQGRVMVLTSDSAEIPYPGLIPYSTSKSALRAYAVGLAAEFTDLRVTDVFVGPTAGTEVSSDDDPELFMEWLPRWHAMGLMRYQTIQVGEVAGTIIDTLASDSPPSFLQATGPRSSQTLEEIFAQAPDDQPAVGSALKSDHQ
jgi:NAD(P)-dependent dehydrogenase (short-subunit alcohol dehydrogenase family)